MKQHIKNLQLLALVFMLTLHVVPVHAATTTDAQDINSIASQILSIALESPTDYGFTEASTNFQMTEAFTPFTYNENGLLEEITNMKHYFIYSDDKPVATLITNTESNSVTFETDLAKELDAFGCSSFTVLCNEYGTDVYYWCDTVLAYE